MNEINLCDIVKDTKMCAMSGVDFQKNMFHGVKSKKFFFYIPTSKFKTPLTHCIGNVILNILTNVDDFSTFRY